MSENDDEDDAFSGLLTQCCPASSDEGAVDEEEEEVVNQPPPSASASRCDDEDEDVDDTDDEEEEEEERDVMTFMEIREMKMKRNHELLERLGLASGPFLSGRSKPGKKRAREEEEEDDEPEQPRGMLLPSALESKRHADSSAEGATATQSTSSATVGQAGDEDDTPLDALYNKYPHRESQIRQLVGILAPITVGCGPNTFVVPSPAPILISGPSGTGKSAVVRDILHSLSTMASTNKQQPQESAVECCDISSSSAIRAATASPFMLATAYVNCATLDVPSSMEELTSAAYKQFEAQIRQHLEGDGMHARKKTKMKKRKIGNTNGGVVDSSANNKDDNGHTKNGEEEAPADNNKYTRTLRPRSAVATENSYIQKNERTKRSVAEEIATTQSSFASLTAAYRFGRSCRALFQKHRHYSGILVLDHAERLLSFLSRNNKSQGEAARCNLLGQLFLLPRTLGINLTVVAITNSILLEHSRLNTPISSVNSAAQPICVRFPAYRGKSIMKKILQQPHATSLIVGEDLRASAANTETSVNGSSTTFKHLVIDSFLDTLVQSLQSTTTDVKDMVRVGRKLFPKYILPIAPENFDKTIQSARKSILSSHPNSNADIDDKALQREVISLLDRKILPALRLELERGLWSLESREGLPSSQHDLPMLAKYLLLAAFLCQENRPDRDKYLFSIQKNGRRKRKDANRGDEEDVAYGPGAQQQPKMMFRPKTFPMERMLSVYVSMVGLNSSSSSTFISGEERQRSLGGPAFFDNLTQLRDIGLLLEYPSRTATESVRLTEPRYWTPLTMEDAQAVALSLNFPLDRYIL